MKVRNKIILETMLFAPPYMGHMGIDSMLKAIKSIFINYL